MADRNEFGEENRDMNERENNNLQVPVYNEMESSNDDNVPDDAWPVCPKCLRPCHPLQYYCPHCDSNNAINPLTPYIAFLNIRFNYDIFITMWRKIWYDKQTLMISRLFYLLMVTAFVPVIVVLGLPLLFVGKIPQPELRKVTTLLLCIIAIVLLFLFIRYELFTGLVSGPRLR